MSSGSWRVNHWPVATIIEALQAWSKANGGQVPTQLRWENEGTRPSVMTIKDRMGSWNMALAGAGMVPRPRQGGRRRQEHRDVENTAPCCVSGQSSTT